MENDPELSGKYLGNITKDFALVSDTLKDASYQIRVRNFSPYPIFPISRVEIPIGTLLIPKQAMALEWNFYASFLDEFEQRQLIEDKSSFISAYRDPDEFCCLFVVDEDFTKIVFIPYPED